jgi:hypothetical protein
VSKVGCATPILLVQFSIKGWPPHPPRRRDGFLLKLIEKAQEAAVIATSARTFALQIFDVF